MFFRGVLLLLALTGPARAAAPLTIVCLGDSVTKGVRSGVKPEETFCALLKKSLTESGRKARVINAGIGGNTTADALARFDRDVLVQQPTHVVIMFGLNDSWIDTGKTASRLTVAEYAANLKKMIATLQERHIVPILMTSNPAIAPRYGPERNVTLKKYVEAMRTVAQEDRILLLDVYARFAELALEGVDLNTLFTDAMHPNPKGHALIAGMLAPAFPEPEKR
jgi:lysophospholipase L1-like esterase